MADVDLSASRQTELRVTNIAIVILALFFVGLRFVGRWMKGFGVGIDDLIMVVATIFLLAAFATCLIGIHFGLGKHAAALSMPEIVSYAKSLVAFECLYVTCICFTKISLLLMYMRIFPTKTIKHGAYILGAISVAWCISIICVSIFQCTPIPKIWNPLLEGHCINLKGSFIGNAIPNILTDVAILALPMPQVWNLRTSLNQKLQITFVFLLGSFVIFTSIYRFTTLFQFQPADITWTLATAETWCVVESASGIISACLPTLGPLVQIVTRRLGISTISRSTNKTPANSHLQTIGGGNNGRSGRKTQGSGNFEDLERNNTGSRPFQRLDWEHDWPDTDQTTLTTTKRDFKDGESISSDEIPLHRIKIRTDVEWKEDPKRATIG